MTVQLCIWEGRGAESGGFIHLCYKHQGFVDNDLTYNCVFGRKGGQRAGVSYNCVRSSRGLLTYIHMSTQKELRGGLL